MSTPKTILCIDIEATCWEGRPPNKYPEQRNEIIEIGVTPVDVKTREIGKSRGIIVIPPTTDISPFCEQLTSITKEMIVKEGIEFSHAMEILVNEYRCDKNIFASWGEYDRKSFEKNCKWNNTGYPFSNMHLNVKTLFSVIYGYNAGLGKCADDLGIKFEGRAHRGVDDSRMVAKVLVHLLQFVRPLK